MLLRLHIQDLAIIDSLTLDFTSGFTVLTGETGAGKSIVIGALNLVLGERASSDDVRSGCDRAVAEALFQVQGQKGVRNLLAGWNLLEDDTHQLVIRREISAQGRSRCLVNGRLIPLGQLKQIGDLLVDLHGQHQHQSLLKVESHGAILDAYGGAGLAKALDAYQQLFRQYNGILARLRALDRDEREIQRQKDILEYQLKEISEAALTPGEDTHLEEERSRLSHADVLLRNTADANNLLFEGEGEAATVADLLGRCEQLLEASAGLDGSLENLTERLGSARLELEDIAATLRTYSSGIEHDPARLSEVEDRLHLVRKLKGKYGATLEEILAEGSRLEEELHALTHSREEQERLEEERAPMAKELARAAERLSGKRKETGEKFAKALGRHLQDLEMPDVRFQVRLAREEAADPESGGLVLSFPKKKFYRVHEHGVDQIEFLISPNPGEDLKPLRKIASGGELSRIMLALKMIMRAQDQIPTLVFDEIDVGISGRTGTRIGECMTQLGEKYQVLCITHLAQIAVKGDDHFSVTKVQEKRRNLTRVDRLDEEGRLHEIARLLGGDSTSIARKHARELMTHQGDSTL